MTTTPGRHIRLTSHPIEGVELRRRAPFEPAGIGNEQIRLDQNARKGHALNPIDGQDGCNDKYGCGAKQNDKNQGPRGLLADVAQRGRRRRRK